MEKINFKRVILGGLVGLFGVSEKDFLLQANSIVTSLMLLFTGLLIAINFVGVFPLKLTPLSLVFNLVVLPTAILFGASICKEESLAT